MEELGGSNNGRLPNRRRMVAGQEGNGRNGRLLENHLYILNILIKFMSSSMSGVSIKLQLTKTYSEMTTGFSNFAFISLKYKVTPNFFGISKQRH